MRAQQTVSKMVVEALVSQAEALLEGKDRTFLEAYEEVLETPAGRLLAALADGSDGHRKAAEWQEGLIAELQEEGEGHEQARGVSRVLAREAPSKEG